MKWKEVKGYEGVYLVSECGLIKSKRYNREKILKEDTNRAGYKRVTLSNQGVTKRFFIHRLVAEHWVEGRSEALDVVNHKDGDKTNNHKDNLEWVDCSSNTIHAFDTGLRATGELAANAQITDEAVHIVCRLIQEGKTRGNILSLNLHPLLNKSKVDDIRRKRCWKRISSQYTW